MGRWYSSPTFSYVSVFCFQLLQATAGVLILKKILKIKTWHNVDDVHVYKYFCELKPWWQNKENGAPWYYVDSFHRLYTEPCLLVYWRKHTQVCTVNEKCTIFLLLRLTCIFSLEGESAPFSAGEIIVRHKFLVLRRERQALLRIMLPIGNSTGGYVRQITVPHHHTTGRGFIHESVTHSNTDEETQHGETRTRGCEMNKCWSMFPRALHDVLKCLLSSTTTQRCSIHCHRGVKRPENIHLSWAGLRELLLFSVKQLTTNPKSLSSDALLYKNTSHAPHSSILWFIGIFTVWNRWS